jgi:glucosylceramidase
MRLNILLKRLYILALVITFSVSCSTVPSDPITDGERKEGDVEFWLTTADKSSLLQRKNDLTFDDAATGRPILEIDTTQKFQTMDGFGYALTGGSAFHINQNLSAEQRSALLKELFRTDENNIGISYLRVSIGASDLDAKVFSYNDLPAGQTDPNLTNFTLAEDKKNVIPVLKEILAINPDIKIMGSPWSPPVWMKDNKLAQGGKLLPEFYSTYANYFVKYIQGMAAEGITIDAVTPQNEPEHPGNTPSLAMTAPEQLDFVKNHLGPAFEKAGIKTKIVIYDHNCDHPQYPISILNDPDAKKYIDGSAFHMYLGEVTAMSTVHDAHPDKNIYFTEQWTSGQGKFDEDLRWHVRELMIGAPRNWAKVVLEWNLAADAKFDPHTDNGGCTLCQGALTIQNGTITRNVSYYIIGHGSKFVTPGSVRVGSNITEGLHSVAYQRPDGKKVLIVVNDNDSKKDFAIKFKNKIANAGLAAGAVATYVW